MHTCCAMTASTGFLQGKALRAPVLAQRAPQRAPLDISARYRGKGTDLAKIPQFKRHDKDVGSPEVQVARLTARVEQLTAHLKIHRKDYATTRGLMLMLGQRKRLLEYLMKTDKDAYERLLSELGIRRVKAEGRL